MSKIVFSCPEPAQWPQQPWFSPTITFRPSKMSCYQ